MPRSVKKTACGTCWRTQRTYYDRKTRRVRDLSWGDTRVYLEVEIRRVPWPELRRREAREAALVGEQPLLHQAVRLLRGPALSVRDDPGCGARTPPRLEDGQGAGNGVHARATPTGRGTRPEGDRHRRDLHRQGAQLPHRRERSDPRSADL